MVNSGYPTINHGGTVKRVHKIIAGFVIADHANRDRSDNRRCNLRAATPSQNAMNRSMRSDSTSGVTGVNKRGDVWSVRIQVDGVRKFIGQYESFDEACEARRVAQEEAFGEFAV